MALGTFIHLAPILVRLSLVNCYCSAMTRLLAYFLTALLLLQVLGRELLVLHFVVKQATITARFCVNEARPALHCDGKCYLAQRLRRAESGPAKAPAGAVAKVKFEGVAPTRLGLPLPGFDRPVATLHYAPAVPRTYGAAPLRSVFQPPARLS
jgi:hypothetical protein